MSGKTKRKTPMARRALAFSVVIALLAALAIAATGCSAQSSSSSSSGSTTKADTVVYGTIYTSNDNQDVVEAAAIKDGVYVYVGDKAGAQAYVGDNTEVIEQTEGMVMAGGTEAHGHYIQDALENFMCKTSAENFDDLKKDVKAFVEENPDRTVYGGAGFIRENDLAPNSDIDYAKQLDEICSDKPIFIFDNDHHQAIVNTKAMELMFPKMGVSLVDQSKGREDKESFAGGIILRLADGTANGYLRDQAELYMAYNLLNDALTDSEYESAMQILQTTLYKQGYTNYLEGLANIMGDKGYEAMCDAEAAGKLKVNVAPYFGVFVAETKDDAGIESAVAKIEEFGKKASTHIVKAGVKVFADGCTEGATGLNDIPYVGTDNYGSTVFDEDTIYKITKAANAKGISVHSHSYGNVAVQRTINAFIKAQNEVNNGTKNSMTHVHNIFTEDYQRMADNDIAVAVNINWGTTMTEKVAEAAAKTIGIPTSLQADAYPIKSFVENGVLIASSTDAPCANDCPTDLFGILEIAVDRTALSWIDGMPESKQQSYAELGLVEGQLNASDVINAKENVDVKTALDIMTINGAELMGVGDRCGSIEVGKSADFILVDKNVLECPTNEIHSAKTQKVYFEGKKVYDAQ